MKMQELFSELDEPIDTNKKSLPTPNKPDNKDKHKKRIIQKRQMIKNCGAWSKFRRHNFDVEKEEKRVIDKMKNINIFQVCALTTVLNIILLHFF